MLSVSDWVCDIEAVTGKTTSTDEGDQNLSIEVLTDDLVELLQTVFPDAAKAPTLLVQC